MIAAAPILSTKNRLRVLVVEDNLDGVHSMVRLFQDLGHDVEFAINGFAALAVARKFVPDVIVLDMLLPDINGDRVAKQLRYERALQNTRIVAVSAQAAQKEKAEEAGITEFYLKPVDGQAWEDIIQGAGRPRH